MVWSADALMLVKYRPGRLHLEEDWDINSVWYFFTFKVFICCGLQYSPVLSWCCGSAGFYVFCSWVLFWPLFFFLRASLRGEAGSQLCHLDTHLFSIPRNQPFYISQCHALHGATWFARKPLAPQNPCKRTLPRLLCQRFLSFAFFPFSVRELFFPPQHS